MHSSSRAAMLKRMEAVRQSGYRVYKACNVQQPGDFLADVEMTWKAGLKPRGSA